MLFTRRNIVYNETPPVTSRAALILLKVQLSDSERQEWNEFREKILDERGLVCEYCGKTDLVRELAAGVSRSRLATIDHLVPVSKGGAVYDRDNLRVACNSCNMSKGDLMVEEWLARRIFQMC